MSTRRRQAAERREATIKDVALEAGVSPMTVSRVINRKGNVRQSTIDRIEKAIAKVDYRPNIVARRLSGGRTYQLLTIFNNPNVTWTAEVLIGMLHACHKIGYHLLIEGVGDYEGEAVGARQTGPRSQQAQSASETTPGPHCPRLLLSKFFIHRFIHPAAAPCHYRAACCVRLMRPALSLMRKSSVRFA